MVLPSKRPDDNARRQNRALNGVITPPPGPLPLPTARDTRPT